MTSMEDVLVDCTLRLARNTKSELTGPAKHAWKVAFDKTVGHHLRNNGLAKWDKTGKTYVCDKIDKIAARAQENAGKGKITRKNIDEAVESVIKSQRKRITRLMKKKPELGPLLEWCTGY